MNTDNENKSEELNESELDNVAGGRAPRTRDVEDPTGELGDSGFPTDEEGPANPEDDAPQEDGPIHV